MNRATPRLERLYRAWSEGGAGLVITGNVQVDRRYLERPGNVVIDGNGGLDALRAYAAAGTAAGNHLWMQINHPWPPDAGPRVHGAGRAVGGGAEAAG
jgi:2,4-dienoyl-CoA reductase-like NADH-dependent reductase (Old Yellow Enzyme family)